LLLVLAFALLSGLAVAARAQAPDVLCPCYNTVVGTQAINQCPAGQLSRLVLILNPNSGPGAQEDKEVTALLQLAESKGVRVLFYIDLVAIPGDGLIPKSAKERNKTPDELLEERGRYSKFYAKRKWWGWFFDDVRPGNQDGFLCIQNWPGALFLNAGTAFTPPDALSKAVVVISEQAKAWPRDLTKWESTHRSQCAVIGLMTSDVPKFLKTTALLGYRMSYPSDDKWKAKQSAYGRLSPQFKDQFAE
jgi:hypothetical protein